MFKEANALYEELREQGKDPAAAKSAVVSDAEGNVTSMVSKFLDRISKDHTSVARSYANKEERSASQKQKLARAELLAQENTETSVSDRGWRVGPR